MKCIAINQKEATFEFPDGTKETYPNIFQEKAARRPANFGPNGKRTPDSTKVKATSKAKAKAKAPVEEIETEANLLAELEALKAKKAKFTAIKATA
jgi:hypothetical protein